MQFLKQFIYRLLGTRYFLRTLHMGFFVMFDLGFLKRNYIYKYHYFVKHLIGKEDVVVDLGANLGYYTRIFCRLLGEKGKVIAIEPVKPFYDTVVWGTRKHKNKVLYNYALGTENKIIQLSAPGDYGYLRSGLSHVADASTQQNDFIFNAEMVRGSELLAGLERIDYIKCDIEGYEEFVLPEMRELIRKHQPILQIETWGTHLSVVFQMMEDLHYQRYCVYKGKMIKDFDSKIEYGDYLFLPEARESEIVSRLQQQGLA